MKATIQQGSSTAVSNPPEKIHDEDKEQYLQEIIDDMEKEEDVLVEYFQKYNSDK